LFLAELPLKPAPRGKKIATRNCNWGKGGRGKKG